MIPASVSSPALGECVCTVSLAISCTKLLNLDTLSKSDPFVEVIYKDPTSAAWVTIGKTEVINDNLSPSFVKRVRVAYLFEVVQELGFRVWDYDSAQKSEFLGEATCKLTDILLSPSGGVTLELKASAGSATPADAKAKKLKRGTITVTGDEDSGPNIRLELSFSAKNLDKKDLFGKSDPFLVLSRVRSDGTMNPVAKTDVIKNTLNPTWKELRTSSRELCGARIDAPLQIECFDWNKSSPPELIGRCMTSVAEFQQPVPLTWQLKHPKKEQKDKKYQHSGILQLTKVVQLAESSFFEFLRGGLQISVIAAIDFTASNGNPSYTNSLHYATPYAQNQYQAALSAVVSVLAPYDHDSLIPVYGFGLIDTMNRALGTQHCYPLAPQPALGVAGVMSQYSMFLPRVELSGPTIFSPLIDAAATAARQSSGLAYTVLLIITDGVVNDVQQTIDSIVDASSLPLSIIIIGVGTADFNDMNRLDADETPLIHSRTKQSMTRDIVQFVPFRDFAKSPALLSKEVLHELPTQVVQYFQSRHVVPPKPAPYAPAAVAATSTTASASAYDDAPPSYDLATSATSSLPPPTAPPHDFELDDRSSDNEPPPAYPDLH